MKKDFNTLFELSQVVKIYIPSTINVNEPAKELQEKFTTEALGLFADCFGGATMTAALGSYRAASGALVVESVNIVYAFSTPEQVNNNFSAIWEFGQKVCKEMAQESIGLEYNGRFGFIEL